MSAPSLQEEVNRLTASLEALADEKESLVNQYEEDFDRRRAEMEEASRSELEESRKRQESEMGTMSGRLDQMQRAFSGDPCGWKEAKDRKTGKVSYKNSETGEESEEMPMIMEVAGKLSSMEEGEADKNALQKAKNK